MEKKDFESRLFKRVVKKDEEEYEKKVKRNYLLEFIILEEKIAAA